MSGSSNSNSGLVRWLKFNLVGAIGVGIQLTALSMLKSVLNINYLLATALAVEASVLNNFIWHERFTWRDRGTENRASRLLKFNFTTGAISILGNLTAMKLLVGVVEINYLAANLLSISACSLLNFLISDRTVFTVRTQGCATSPSVR
jgi:putative flippase GtrA